MSVAGLFLRMLDKNTYPGWVVLGGWGKETANEADKERIDKMFRRFVQPEVDAMFNQWQIRPTHDGRFSAVRFTWETGGWVGTLDEIESKLEGYYERYNINYCETD
jgi:hypothetical protein